MHRKKAGRAKQKILLRRTEVLRRTEASSPIPEKATPGKATRQQAPDQLTGKPVQADQTMPSIPEKVTGV
jgi:hypothetical protein